MLICGKLLLQEFWKEGKEWDLPAFEELSLQFCQYIADLSHLSSIKIPKRIFEEKFNSIFAFCDASKKAYAQFFVCDIS